MPLTIATALQLADRDCDFLRDPGTVLARLPDPDVLLPLAAALQGRTEDEIAQELDAEKYHALQDQLEKAILDFFPLQRRELIIQCRDAIANVSRDSALSVLESLQKTRQTPPGGPESGAPQESSASTLDHSPSDSSKTCDSDTSETSGTSSASSEAGSSTASPAAVPSTPSD